MSTNYYMRIFDKKIVDKYFPFKDYEEEEMDGDLVIVENNKRCIIEHPNSYLVHIGKRSSGWLPLFQAHKTAYNSVMELKNFLREHPEIQIEDEYENSMTLKELQEEFFNWGKNSPHYRYKRIMRPHGGYTLERAEDDYKGPCIQGPLSHIEYMKFLEEGSPYITYTKDADGYEFTDGDFS